MSSAEQWTLHKGAGKLTSDLLARAFSKSPISKIFLYTALAGTSASQRRRIYLPVLEGKYSIFNGISNNETLYKDRLKLSQAMNAVERLTIVRVRSRYISRSKFTYDSTASLQPRSREMTRLALVRFKPTRKPSM
jgi:hypothetical protein